MPLPILEKKILEAAAAAAKYEIVAWDDFNSICSVRGRGIWDPLRSSKDAFDLLVAMRFSINIQAAHVTILSGNMIVSSQPSESNSNEDVASAARHAIVVAASSTQGVYQNDLRNTSPLNKLKVKP